MPVSIFFLLTLSEARHETTMSGQKNGLVDIYTWLSVPGEVGAFTSSTDITGVFYESVLQLFTKLLRKAKERQPEGVALHLLAIYSHELRRFYLWGDGLSVSQGQLDKTLSSAPELRANVLSLILQLSHVLSSEICRFLNLNIDGAQGEEELQRALNNVRLQREQVGQLLHDSDFSLDFPCDVESIPDSQLAEISQDDVADELATYIDCLMDLCQAIERPALDVSGRGLNADAKTLETFDVSSIQAHVYCRRIRDQYPQLPRYLVERLGELNSQRYSRILELEEWNAYQDTEQVEVIKPPSVQARSESLFSDRYRHSSLGTRSLTAPSSVFDTSHGGFGVTGVQKAAYEPPILQNDDETSSLTTYASLVTNESGEKTEARARVPPLPEGAQDGVPFMCLVCRELLTGVRTRSEWK